MEADNLSEVMITATYEQFKEFVASVVWQDMKRELEVQKGMILDSLGRAETRKEVYRLQGQLLACNDFIAMPTDFIAMLEARFAQSAVLPPKSGVDADFYDQYEEPIDGNGL